MTEGQNQIIAHLNLAMFGIGAASRNNQVHEHCKQERIETIKRRIVRLRNELLRQFEESSK